MLCYGKYNDEQTRLIHPDARSGNKIVVDHAAVDVDSILNIFSFAWS
jgi:hypothetical protein